MTLTERQRWILENAVVFSVGAAYAIFHRVLAFKTYFILPILAAAAIYIILETRRGRRTARDFGLRLDNLGEASQAALWVFLPFAFGLVAYGLWKQTPVPRHFYYTLAFYPVWGLIQQLVFQGFFCGNLLRLGWGKWAVPASALFYASVHGPNAFMLFATLVGGIAFSTLYYRRPNVIPLGIAHGILGALLYFMVLGRDPILRLIAKGTG